MSALGRLVTSTGGGIGWINILLMIWLLPQQLGITWKRGRFAGPGTGAAFILLGLVWLGGAIASGYPVVMVGGDAARSSSLTDGSLCR